MSGAARSSIPAGSNSGPRPTEVAIALGSNVGDRLAHLTAAVDRLRSWLTELTVSSWYETDPVDVVGQQTPFLNGVAIGRTSLAPAELLSNLQIIETERGRTRPFKGAARTLDLDLILYGDQVVDEPGLRIPHPRFRERRFVLDPLAEVAGTWIDPETGCTVAELRDRVRTNTASGPGTKNKERRREGRTRR